MSAARSSSGLPKYLTDEESKLEDVLVHWLCFGRMCTVFSAVNSQEVVIRKGLSVHVTHGWWDSFKCCHPKLTFHTATPVSYPRLVAIDPKNINVNLLELTLSENILLDKSVQIRNFDETGVPLHHSPPSETPLSHWIWGLDTDDGVVLL